MGKQLAVQQTRTDYPTPFDQEKLNDERRQSARIAETLPVRLKGKAAEAYLFSADMSLGGIRLIWNTPLPVGDRIDISIALKSLKTWLHVKGEVIWQTPTAEKYEIGVRFVEVPEDQRAKLDRYLKGTTALRNSLSGHHILPSFQEKRRHKRIPRLLVVVIETRGEFSRKTSGMIVDISLGGARLITNYRLPKGTRVVLKIDSGDHQLGTAQIPGHVVWASRVEALKRSKRGAEFLHAVEFEPYSQEFQRTLEGFVSYRNSTKELNLVQILLATLHEKQ